MAHTIVECDNCGLADDHPKLHYGDETYHHDCIPARVARDLNMEDPMLSAIVAAADDGIHGDELRAHIQELHG